MCITEKGKKYMSLMEELKSKILSGEIRPGAKLPSENELAQEYEISRHTVRKALAILVTDGYITTKHGKGTFCSDRMAHRKNSKNIAVVTTYISDYIFPRLIQGMDRVLTEQGYSIMLKNKFRNGIMYKKSLLLFMDKYHIEDKHEDALMKSFQRWKKRVEEERKK